MLPQLVVKVNINSVSRVDTMCPLYDEMEMALYLHGLPSQIPWRQSDREKNIREIPTEGAFYKIPDQNFLKLSGTLKKKKKEESLKICQNQEKPRETLQLNIMWCPRWDPAKEKGQ